MMKLNGKKVIALISAAMLLVGSMTACGSGDDTKDDAQKTQQK